MEFEGIFRLLQTSSPSPNAIPPLPVLLNSALTFAQHGLMDFIQPLCRSCPRFWESVPMKCEASMICLKYLPCSSVTRPLTFFKMNTSGRQFCRYFRILRNTISCRQMPTVCQLWKIVDRGSRRHTHRRLVLGHCLLR